MSMYTTEYSSILPSMQFKTFIKIHEEDFRFEESEIFYFAKLSMFYDTFYNTISCFIFSLKVSFKFIKKWESRKNIKYKKKIIDKKQKLIIHFKKIFFKISNKNNSIQQFFQYFTINCNDEMNIIIVFSLFLSIFRSTRMFLYDTSRAQVLDT